MSNPLLPSTLPISISAAIAGVSPAAFTAHILPMLETENGRVVTRSLERNLDRLITPEVYLTADRKMDKARQYQKDRNVEQGQLDKIDRLISLMSRHETLSRAPEMLGSIFKPTEIALRNIRMALYGAALILISEISEELP
jgi:hypothetical protein